ncbi:MAG: folylpolyglutamate synthase/dihydrofolate synthase family protein [Bacteroidota bacterium]|nr:folylpolyglutamate synthase/dihydrofolate synthase family protein [Bacteroidota bacterium]
MNYQQTLDYMLAQLPMFHRIGAAAYKADLGNTLKLCEITDYPYRHFQSVHIAGTNGKGSVSHFLASILQTSGKKVGLYTSPHLRDFRERIRVNGEMIPEAYVVAFVEKYRNDFDRIQPSFFEMNVALAFSYFADEKVDIAIVETGLGGRLDSTNVISPLVSVITNIGLDHVQFLGNTLELIAGEKAGIIKPQTPVVIGQTQPETVPVFRKKAAEMISPIYFADEEFELRNASYFVEEAPTLSLDVWHNGKPYLGNLRSPLAGSYQPHNILTVIQTARILESLGWETGMENIRTGIENVISNTGFAGRWQMLQRYPLTICDIGHNVDGIREVVKQLVLTPHQQLHIVFGVVSDKDVTGMLKLLPKDATYYFCNANLPRALKANLLAEKGHEAGLKGEVWPSVREAKEAALNAAGRDDLVYIGGSAFVVAEAI